MSRIQKVFESLASRGEGAYIPYVCAGDPDMQFTLRLVDTLVEAGADIVELGLPFSDPVADGPVIQQAMNRSLGSGFRVSDLFDAVSSVRGSHPDLPIVVMTYYNPVLRAGPSQFCSRLAEAGGDAVLVVDLPPEESSELDSAARASGLDTIRLVAPNTDDGRLGSILSSASGFVYAVSVAGVTGSRSELAEASKALLRRVSSASSIPVALGFGISEPAHVSAAMESGAAGVVEGSKLVSLYASSEDPASSLRVISEHAGSMKAAASRAPLPRE